jgi:hypothetical protein
LDPSNVHADAIRAVCPVNAVNVYDVATIAVDSCALIQPVVVDEVIHASLLSPLKAFAALFPAWNSDEARDPAGVTSAESHTVPVVAVTVEPTPD